MHEQGSGAGDSKGAVESGGEKSGDLQSRVSLRQEPPSGWQILLRRRRGRGGGGGPPTPTSWSTPCGVIHFCPPTSWIKCSGLHGRRQTISVHLYLNRHLNHREPMSFCATSTSCPLGKGWWPGVVVQKIGRQAKRHHRLSPDASCIRHHDRQSARLLVSSASLLLCLDL